VEVKNNIAYYNTVTITTAKGVANTIAYFNTVTITAEKKVLSIASGRAIGLLQLRFKFMAKE
jgi:hypothetical protein